MAENYPIIPQPLKPTSITPVRRWILETLKADTGFGIKPVDLRNAYKKTQLAKAQHGDRIYNVAVTSLIMEGCVAQPTGIRPYLWYIKGLDEE